MYHFEIEKRKSELKSRVRSFFNTRGIVEVETPLLSATTIPEHSIALFNTEKSGEFTSPETLYLLPSPELYMKKMLCKYKKSIFQICKAFRNAEQDSSIHKNEFTMLEYYCIDSTYTDTIKLTENLIKDVFHDAKDHNLLLDAKITSVDELLLQHIGLSLADLHKRECQNLISEKFNLSLPENESFDDTFNRIFVHIIEPELSKIAEPIFIKDYPVEIECLAKEKNSLERERFELYFKGIELANGYSEMCDNNKIRQLFEDEKAKIRTNQRVDDDLKNLIMPDSSGVAIGFDRLVMAAENISNINDLIF